MRDQNQKLGFYTISYETKELKKTLLEAPLGFKRINGSVIDVDECETGQHYCRFIYLCINTIGSFKCDCRNGHTEVNNNCEDVNECHYLASCPKNSDCDNSIGGFTCTCEPGYGGPDCTTDLDECSMETDNCHKDADCDNTPGSFKCNCREGFHGNGISCYEGTCFENVECKNNSQCASSTAITCNCEPGFEEDASGQCVDIDECTDENSCPKNANCRNLEGNFTCDCFEGFEGNYCTDVNECETKCSDSETCLNTPGSYTCTCDPGFEKINEQCVDVDECSTEIHGCLAKFDCANTDGSYNCLCKEDGESVVSIAGMSSAERKNSLNGLCDAKTLCESENDNSQKAKSNSNVDTSVFRYLGVLCVQVQITTFVQHFFCARDIPLRVLF